MKRRSPLPTQKIAKRHKAKSRVCQQWVCERISKLLDIPWGKDELIESRQMGQSGTDVVLRGDALKRFPAAIECASGESIHWLDKIRQAKKHQRGKRGVFSFWLVFLKRKEFKNPVVILDAGTFFEMMETMHDLSMRRIKSD